MIYYKKGEKMIIILEPAFDILITQDQKIMLVILSRPNMQQSPFLVFDKKKTMALFRDKNEILKLTEIPRKALKALRSATEVLITEMDEDSNPIRQYPVKIIFDSRLNKKLKKEKQVLY